MKIVDTHNDSKQGKQDDQLIAHKPLKGPLFRAHRLEGKVKNMGIKNLGHQKKKSKSGDK